MSIIVADKEFRTLSDEFFVNGKKVIEAYLGDGTKVYPEDEYAYILKLYGSWQQQYIGSHGTRDGERVPDSKVFNVTAEAVVSSDAPVILYESDEGVGASITAGEENLGKRVAATVSVSVGASGTPTPPIEDCSQRWDITYGSYLVVRTYDNPGGFNSCSGSRSVSGEISYIIGDLIQVPWYGGDPEPCVLDAMGLRFRTGVGIVQSTDWSIGSLETWFVDQYTMTYEPPVHDESRNTSSFDLVDETHTKSHFNYQSYEWIRRPGQEG